MDPTELPTWAGERILNAVIESPRGCGAKLKWDPDLLAFAYGRALPLGLTYPYCWGFIPRTQGPDGDPLDVFVLSEIPLYPGVIVPSRLVAVIELEQNGKKGGRVRNDRILAVPVEEPRIAETFSSLREIPGRLRQEMEQFFLGATFFTDKEARILGWNDAAVAERLVRRFERK